MSKKKKTLPVETLLEETAPESPPALPLTGEGLLKGTIQENKDRNTGEGVKEYLSSLREVRRTLQQPLPEELVDLGQRNELRQALVEENKSPQRFFTNIVEGDHRLDPELNPDHPVQGRAHAERELAQLAEGRKRRRLEELRNRKKEDKEPMHQMRIVDTRARNMFVDLGLPLAAALDFDGLKAKLVELPQILDVLKEPADVNNKRLRDRVLEAIQKGDEIVIIQERPVGPGAVPPAGWDKMGQGTKGGKRAKKVKGMTKKVKGMTGKGQKSTKRQRQAMISAAEAPSPNGDGKESPVGQKALSKAKRGRMAKTTGETGGKGKNPMSAADAAAKVLAETKKAMLPAEIIGYAAAKGYWKSPKGKTPDATIRVRMTEEIEKLGKKSRFKKEGSAFLLA